MPKLIQILNSRGAISAVQKEARVLRSKRKAIEISQGDPVTKPKAVSKAGRRVITKRSKAVITRGGVLKRLVRSLTKTAKARPDNTK